MSNVIETRAILSNTIDEINVRASRVRNGVSPCINPDTMTWWEYSDVKGKMVDTNIPAYAGPSAELLMRTKNIFPYPYTCSYSDSSWDDVRHVVDSETHGITVSAPWPFTVEPVMGGRIVYIVMDKEIPASEYYWLQGCPENGGAGRYAMNVYDMDPGSNNLDRSNIIGTDYGNGTVVVGHDPDKNIAVEIVIWPGQYDTSAGIEFFPLLMAIEDSTYDEKIDYILQKNVLIDDEARIAIQSEVTRAKNAERRINDELTYRVGSMQRSLMIKLYRDSNGDLCEEE